MGCTVSVLYQVKAPGAEQLEIKDSVQVICKDPEMFLMKVNGIRKLYVPIIGTGYQGFDLMLKPGKQEIEVRWTGNANIFGFSYLDKPFSFTAEPGDRFEISSQRVGNKVQIVMVKI